MRISRVKHLFVLLMLGAVTLLALACSSQVPASTTMGGAQASEETVAAVQEVVLESSTGPNPARANAPVAPTPESSPIVAEPDTTPRVEGSVGVAVSESSVTGVDEGDDFQAQVSGQDRAEAAGIVVSGSGRAGAAPDLATLRLGVEAIEATVGEARTAAAESMSAVMASVKDHGVEDKDIQTGYFSIQPRYTGREITRCVEAESSSGESEEESGGLQEGPASGGISLKPSPQECFQEYRSVITGYEVSNSLTVLVRDLETVDDVIDGAVDAGGDHIRFNGLSFSLEDTKALETEARSAAVSDLEAKARELAGLAGVGLGDLVYLTETGGGAPPIVRAVFAMERAAADAFMGSAATPISPGEVVISVSVVGQYLIATEE